MAVRLAGKHRLGVVLAIAWICCVSSIAAYQFHDATRTSNEGFFVGYWNHTTGEYSGLSKAETIELATLQAEERGVQLTPAERADLDRMQITPTVILRRVVLIALFPPIAVWIFVLVVSRAISWVKEGFAGDA